MFELETDSNTHGCSVARRTFELNVRVRQTPAHCIGPTAVQCGCESRESDTLRVPGDYATDAVSEQTHLLNRDLVFLSGGRGAGVVAAPLSCPYLDDVFTLRPCFAKIYHLNGGVRGAAR